MLNRDVHQIILEVIDKKNSKSAKLKDVAMAKKGSVLNVGRGKCRCRGKGKRICKCKGKVEVPWDVHALRSWTEMDFH